MGVSLGRLRCVGALVLVLVVAAATAAPFDIFTFTRESTGTLTTNVNYNQFPMRMGPLPVSPNDLDINILFPRGTFIHPMVGAMSTEFSVDTAAVADATPLLCNGTATDIPSNPCRIDIFALGQPGAPLYPVNPIVFSFTYTVDAPTLARLRLAGIILPSYPVASTPSITSVVRPTTGEILITSPADFGPLGLGTDFGLTSHTAWAFQRDRRAGALTAETTPLALGTAGGIELRGWADFTGSALRTVMFPTDSLTLTLPPVLEWGPGAVACALCVGSQADCADSLTVTGAAAPGVVTDVTRISASTVRLALTHGQNCPYLATNSSSFAMAYFKVYCTNAVVRGVMTDARLGVQYKDVTGQPKTILAYVPIMDAPVTAPVVSGASLSYDTAPTTRNTFGFSAVLTVPSPGLAPGQFVRVQMPKPFTVASRAAAAAPGAAACALVGYSTGNTHISDATFGLRWLGASLAAGATAIAAGTQVTLRCTLVVGPDYTIPAAGSVQYVQLTTAAIAPFAQGTITWPQTLPAQTSVGIVSSTPVAGSAASEAYFIVTLNTDLYRSSNFYFTLPVGWSTGDSWSDVSGVTSCVVILTTSGEVRSGASQTNSGVDAGARQLIVTVTDPVALADAAQLRFVCPAIRVPTGYEPSPSGMAFTLNYDTGSGDMNADVYHSTDPSFFGVDGGTLGPFGSQIHYVSVANPVVGQESTLMFEIYPMTGGLASGIDFLIILPGRTWMDLPGFTCTVHASGVPFPLDGIDVSFGVNANDGGVISFKFGPSAAYFPEDQVFRGDCGPLRVSSITTTPTDFARAGYFDIRGDIVYIANLTSTPIIAGELGAEAQSISHSPSKAGVTGPLTVTVGGMPSNVVSQQGVSVTLPPGWIYNSEGSTTFSVTVAPPAGSAPGTPTGAVVPGTVEVTYAGDPAAPTAVFWMAPGSMLNPGEIITLTATHVRPPTQTAAATTGSIAIIDADKVDVARTDTAPVPAVTPGPLGETYAGVRLSNPAAGVATNVTFEIDGVTNTIPLLGKITVDLPTLPNGFPIPTVSPPGAMHCSITQNGVTESISSVTATATKLEITLGSSSSSAVARLLGSLTSLTCDSFTNPAAPDYGNSAAFAIVTTATPSGVVMDRGTAFSLNAWPDHIEFVSVPSFGQAGGILTPALAVRAVNQFGGPATMGSVTVALDPVSVGSSGAVLDGTLTVPVSPATGIATFPDLKIDEIGSGLVITATYPHTTPISTSPFDVMPLTSLARLRFTRFPYKLVAGEPFTVEIEADGLTTGVLDPAAVVTAALGSMGVLLTPPGAVLAPTPLSASATGGRLVYANITTDSLGQWVLAATPSGGLYANTSSPRFTVYATAAERDAALEKEDRKAARVGFSVIGLTPETLANATARAAVIDHVMAVACAYTPLQLLGQCDRLDFLTLGADGRFTVRVDPHPQPGGRPNAFEVAEILRSLVVDLSSPMHGGGGIGGVGGTPPGGVSFANDPTTVTVEEVGGDDESAWLPLIITASVLGAALLGGLAALAYRRVRKWEDDDVDADTDAVAADGTDYESVA